MTKSGKRGRASLLYGLILGIADECVVFGVMLISDYNRSLILLAILLLLVVLARIPLWVLRRSSGALVSLGIAVLTFLILGLIITHLEVLSKLEQLLGILPTSTGDGSSGMMLVFFLLVILVLDILSVAIALIKMFWDSRDKRK